jgi:hypothetical protein
VTVTGNYTCPSDGYITRADRCTTLSNGILLISLGSNGTYINVSYDKKSGSAITGKLGYLRTGTNHWGPSKTITTTLIATQTWTGVANGCSPTNGLLYSGSTTYQTPAADYC